MFFPDGPRRLPALLLRRYRPDPHPTTPQKLPGGLCQPPWLLLSELFHASYVYSKLMATLDRPRITSLCHDVCEHFSALHHDASAYRGARRVASRAGSRSMASPTSLPRNLRGVWVAWRSACGRLPAAHSRWVLSNRSVLRTGATLQDAALSEDDELAQARARPAARAATAGASCSAARARGTQCLERAT